MDKIAEKLDNINHTLEKILGTMQQPESKFVKILERLMLIAGALGILNAADIVRRWIGG